MATSPARIVVHLTSSDLSRSNRLRKEAASALRDGFATEVRVVTRQMGGQGEERTELADRIVLQKVPVRLGALPRNRLLGVAKLIEGEIRLAEATAALRPVLIHAHGLYTLGPALKAGRATGAPVIYDAHELETEVHGIGPVRQAFDRWRERRLIPRASGVITVADSIADWYAKSYGIRRPTVVRNVPDLRMQSAHAGSSVLRDALGIGPEAVLFIYQGVLRPERMVDRLVRVFSRVAADKHIVFMGFGPSEAMVKAAARARPNIHFHPAVPTGEVLRYAASADVGIAGAEPTCLNHEFMLPNKIFDYLASGLPVLVPAYVELARVVDEGRCGWKVPAMTDDAWCDVIDAISRASVPELKVRAKEAGLRHVWAEEEGRMLALYREVVRG